MEHLLCFNRFFFFFLSGSLYLEVLTVPYVYIYIPIGSMYAIYGDIYLPSIYPSHVSIYTSTMDPMGWDLSDIFSRDYRGLFFIWFL